MFVKTSRCDNCLIFMYLYQYHILKPNIYIYIDYFYKNNSFYDLIQISVKSLDTFRSFPTLMHSCRKP